ncbi:lanthionine synthetase LanC family protein [Microbacterium pumilum]|uniref:Protein kinase domain-containing protein n=1 Tax=Microbacterium pumilum TaxID=344165 RepID=A0ABP5ELY2_9MICO
MRVTDRLILPADVLVMSGDQVDEETRVRCGCGPTDFIVTRPRSRTQSRVVTAEVADLLSKFRTPQTFAEALSSFSSEHAVDPEEILPDAFSALKPFLTSGWLASDSSPGSNEIIPTLAIGSRVAGCAVIECMQAVEDSELYQVRDAAGQPLALKILRSGASKSAVAQFANEAAVLRRLDGAVSPRLVSDDPVLGRECLLMTWLRGVPLDHYASHLRIAGGRAARIALMSLCQRVVELYAELHDAGVVHADIHPRNVLVDDLGTPRLIDFGQSVRDGSGDSATQARKAALEYLEPEYALASLDGRALPSPTYASDQYALSAMLYLVLTGRAYLDFSAVPDEMLRQIAEDLPLPLARRGITHSRELEAILFRGLAKNASARYPTIAAMADDMRRATIPLISPHPHALVHEASARAFLTQFEDVNGFELRPPYPHASITHGSAGVAAALNEIAVLGNDPRALELSDAWMCRAVRTATQARAFSSELPGLERESIPESSVFFGPAGIDVIRARVASAMSDDAALARAVDGLTAWDSGDINHDFTLGRPGLVASLALLIDDLVPSVRDTNQESITDRLADVARAEVSRIRQPHTAIEGDYLGIAHGIAGTAYALVLWCDVSGDEPPAWLQSMVAEIAALGREHGNGLRWPMRVTSNPLPSFMESWCHGSAGMVHLFTAAYRVFDDSQYLELATRAAVTAWEDESSRGTLCCGAVGRAYALLNLQRHVGDSKWTDRARSLADASWELCSRQTATTASLFQGTLGAAVLLSTVSDADRAAFPLFERRAI